VVTLAVTTPAFPWYRPERATSTKDPLDSARHASLGVDDSAQAGATGSPRGAAVRQTD
jgi:hypothetical protein